MFQLTGIYATFADLPIELVIRIVSLAIDSETNLKDARRIYLSLVSVSSQMQEIAHVVCLPQFPIMLRTRESFYSFHVLLESHPTAGSSVRNLWLVPAFSKLEGQQVGGPILLACPQLERLACSASLFETLIYSPPPFRHDRLRDLTITSTSIQWNELPLGPVLALFGQLTHLRLSGARPFEIPSCCFTSLTHISFPCGDVDSAVRTFGSTQFPSLRHIVPTIPYKFCRYQYIYTFRARGRSMDTRVEIMPCPKKWQEREVWEMARRWGEPSIWERALSGSDIR